mmetsp:Transcript_26464/g.47677  ORF Transcript_26464/g.47677 Transcript_26464/m.47677 type:complete len:208 (-) Transcript_26464:2038-2661(-)
MSFLLSTNRHSHILSRVLCTSPGPRSGRRAATPTNVFTIPTPTSMALGYKGKSLIWPGYNTSVSTWVKSSSSAMGVVSYAAGSLALYCLCRASRTAVRILVSSATLSPSSPRLFTCCASFWSSRSASRSSSGSVPMAPASVITVVVWPVTASTLTSTENPTVPAICAVKSDTTSDDLLIVSRVVVEDRRRPDRHSWTSTSNTPIGRP